MPKIQYQYGTSPRKYEIEYKVSNEKKSVKKKTLKKENEIKRRQEEKMQQKTEIKKQISQIFIVIVVFFMLVLVSYREIVIMELFNDKKDLESNLAIIEKENGQIEKDIKEVESTLDWNKIKQVATEQLGMQTKAGIPIDLEKTDFVETENTFIEEDKTSILEKLVEFIVNLRK